MTNGKSFFINDDLFLNTLSCPLKYIHITNDHLNRDSTKLYFRQRNKLHIRDAIATNFKKFKKTSNSTEDAFEETKIWLAKKEVAICGAVVKHDHLLSRIPILLKTDSQLTIIQVHGKLRKKTEGDEIQPGTQKRNINRYLLKAAYRTEVLNKMLPNQQIHVRFFFPNKHFKSSVNNLHLFDQSGFFKSKKNRAQLLNLFIKVDATKAVERVRKHLPAEQVYSYYKKESISSAIEKMKDLPDQATKELEIDRHKSCKYCDFRLPKKRGSVGCWSQFFEIPNIQFPEKHIYELIGHGNNVESKNGTYYQEQAEFSGGFESMKEIINKKSTAFNILDRRNLQIRKAKDLDVPSLWLKKNIQQIQDLKYPLHFLDFEAATYALPMKTESRPYTPVYFQFSCHTLKQTGQLIHTDWLDLQDGNEHPHPEFVHQLGDIPHIFEGTILQYSPFEKQGINRLIADFKRDHQKYQMELKILENIRLESSNNKQPRFFDVSEMIRDFYFNEYLKDSLGLKQVLQSILELERASASNFFDASMSKTLFGKKVDLKELNSLNPYDYVKNSKISISDGSDAMQAWISFKNGLMTSSEKALVPEILRRYCTLDSFAMYVILKHIHRFTGLIDDEDYVLYQQN